MIKRLTYGVIATVGLLGVSVSNAQAAQNCIGLGGTGLANVVNKGTGIVATLTGPVLTARGEITAQKKTATGIAMKMQHIFMNGTGGSMITNDDVILTSVKGRGKQFMINITYHVDESSTTGTLKGYKGVFTSYGLIDLAIGQIIIRYSGKICK